MVPYAKNSIFFLRLKKKKFIMVNDRLKKKILLVDTKNYFHNG